MLKPGYFTTIWNAREWGVSKRNYYWSSSPRQGDPLKGNCFYKFLLETRKIDLNKHYSKLKTSVFTVFFFYTFVLLFILFTSISPWIKSVFWNNQASHREAVIFFSERQNIVRRWKKLNWNKKENMLIIKISKINERTYYVTLLKFNTCSWFLCLSSFTVDRRRMHQARTLWR